MAETFGPGIVLADQGNRLVVKTAGTLQIEAGATVTGLAAVSQQTAEADLSGSLTGTTDGALADIAAIALSTSNTYTDAAVNSAVNTAITSANLQIKELQVKVNALLAKLRTAGVLAT